MTQDEYQQLIARGMRALSKDEVDALAARNAPLMRQYAPTADELARHNQAMRNICYAYIAEQETKARRRGLWSRLRDWLRV